MTSILTSSKNDPYVFCSTLHGLSNAVYRFSMRCVVLEISGGGAEINPPPPVLGWLRPPPVRGLTNVSCHCSHPASNIGAADCQFMRRRTMRQYINLVTSTLRSFYRIIARFNPLIITGSRHRASRARAGSKFSSRVPCRLDFVIPPSSSSNCNCNVGT